MATYDYEDFINDPIYVVSEDEILDVDTTIPHNNYVEQDLVKAKLGLNNICLVKLIDSIFDVKPPKFPNLPPATGARCRSAGWGKISITEYNKESILYEISLKTTTAAIILEMFPIQFEGEDEINFEFNKIFAKTHFFSGSIYIGDAGAPLICKDELQGVAHAYYIIQKLNGTNVMVSVFTQIKPYSEWIDQRLVENAGMEDAPTANKVHNKSFNVSVYIFMLVLLKYVT